MTNRDHPYLSHWYPNRNFQSLDLAKTNNSDNLSSNGMMEKKKGKYFLDDSFTGLRGMFFFSSSLCCIWLTATMVHIGMHYHETSSVFFFSISLSFHLFGKGNVQKRSINALLLVQIEIKNSLLIQEEFMVLAKYYYENWK